MLAVVDAASLVSALEVSDAHHHAVLAALTRTDLRLVLPAMVVAEATHVIARKFGAVIESKFLAGLTSFEIEAPHPDDWARIAELVYQYRDFPLGGTDASVIALAERLGTDLVITLDRRHFAAVRPRHVPSFQILPE